MGAWIRFSNDTLQNIKHESAAARLQPEKVARQDISGSLAPRALPGHVSGLAKILRKMPYTLADTASFVQFRVAFALWSGSSR